MRNELTRRKVLAEEAKKGLSWESSMSFSKKEVSLRMISNLGIEVQTTSEKRFSVPAWFAEVVIIAGYLEQKGILEAFAHQVCLVRGRFGTYEPIDFLALLIGYAISGERTLAEFFERLEAVCKGAKPTRILRDILERSESKERGRPDGKSSDTCRHASARGRSVRPDAKGTASLAPKAVGDHVSSVDHPTQSRGHCQNSGRVGLNRSPGHCPLP